jgi:RND family efflux transporter MFP subunit
MRQYFVILSSAILMTVSACNNTNKKRPQLAQEIPTVSVEKKDIKLDHLYVSDIQAIRNVEIRSKVSGFLEAIYVDEGKAVKKGQALFKLSENEHRNEVAKNRAQLSIAQAEVKSAEVEYKRVQTLVQKNIISKTEQDLAHSRLNAAKSKVDEANSNLENALHKLSYTTIRAPYDGIIDRIPMKIGSLIEDSTSGTKRRERLWKCGNNRNSGERVS